MSEPKWTRGDWVVVLVPGSYQRPALIKGDDKTVASCLGDQLNPEATSIGEAMANASLIASAPDLYTALSLLVEQIQKFPALASDFYGELRNAVAALAKARGEPTR